MLFVLVSKKNVEGNISLFQMHLIFKAKYNSEENKAVNQGV